MDKFALPVDAKPEYLASESASLFADRTPGLAEGVLGIQCWTDLDSAEGFFFGYCL